MKKMKINSVLSFFTRIKYFLEIYLKVKYVPWEKNVRLRRSNKNNKTRLSSSGFTPTS